MILADLLNASYSGVQFGVPALAGLWLGRRWLPAGVYHVGLALVGAVTLVSGWCLLLVWAAFIINGLLVPWDQAAFLAPPAGTWQRTLNDFFNQALPEVMYGFIPVVPSIICLIAGLSRASGHVARANLLSRYAITTLVFLVIQFVVVLLTLGLVNALLSKPLPEDLGYHRTLPALAVVCVLVAAFAHVQWRIAMRSSEAGK